MDHSAYNLAMRTALLMFACLLPLAYPALSQSGSWEHCLPFPTFAEELAQMRAESEITIQVEDIQFVGAPKLSVAQQQRIAASLARHTFKADEIDSDEWEGDLEMYVRDAWQRHGYYAVWVNKIEPHVIATYGRLALVSVTIDVEEGQQYRFGDLTFRNNKVFSSERMRSLFSLKAGDIFATDKVRDGLDALRKLYGQAGYINATVVPNEHIDQLNNVISLDLDVDEGGQFRLGHVEFRGFPVGFDESSARRQLRMKPGDVYNQQLVSLYHPYPKDLSRARCTTQPE